MSQTIDQILRSEFRLGFLGGGQLARMSAVEAFRFGMQIAVFSTSRDPEPVELMTPHVTQGNFGDADAMTRFAESCDVITLENEFIDSDILEEVARISGTPMYPSPETFKLIENKFIEKETFRKAGIPVCPYKLVHSREELEAFGNEHGWPYLLKSSKGGYDGYGNETVNNADEAEKAFTKLGGEKDHDILAEAFVPFRKELAVQVARNHTGVKAYPCCETIQENHICTAVLSPAEIAPELQEKAKEMAIAATEAINGVGLFAYEFFLTEDGQILLNESAPRPHNSGHYTIEGTVTSQFENHVRAVTGLPLGDTSLIHPAAVMINLLGTHDRIAQVSNAMEAIETADAHLHIYGKLKSRPGRKMGHLTLLGDDLAKTYAEAKRITENIQI